MSSQKPVLQGIFAINKPPHITSADALRHLQSRFNASPLFAPLLAEERERRKPNPNEKHQHQPRWRKRKDRTPVQVKLGHGGTLDPLATGVLIVGVGAGTKVLSRFLECTKVYECVVLFGAATDTYDITGKVVARKNTEHVTREAVEEALSKFRGSITQVPPVFSALRVNGKRMYEYARAGGEIPEMKGRELTVEELEVVEWMAPGDHQWRLPEVEAEQEEQTAAQKLLRLDGVLEPNRSLKRKRDERDSVGEGDEEFAAKRTKPPSAPDSQPPEGSLKPLESSESLPTPQPPAAKLRMTVSSGFYVRSLCHDLGAAVGSLGLMASLVRTRQANFALGENVVEWEELEKDEDVWGPKVKEALEVWTKKREDDEGVTFVEDERRWGHRGGKGSYRRHNEARWKSRGGTRRQSQSDDGVMRNSSSEED